jgi:hypothetical protein
MKRRAMGAILVAAGLSALVWTLSVPFTGLREPWDAEGPYYLVALAVLGAASGALVPRPLWGHYIGAVAGQAIYQLLFLNIGPLFILGLLFLLGYSGVFAGAAAMAGLVRTNTVIGKRAAK